MFKRKCKITFICHGSTIYTEENRLSDSIKYPPLNDSGEEEIEKICEFFRLRGVKSSKIYSAPELRAVQSSDLISKVYKCDFEIVNALTNRKYGMWSGLTYNDIEKKYPQMLEQLHENPTSYSPEGGETLSEFNKRIKKIINELVNQNIGNRIIVVATHEVIQSAICSALNLPAKSQAKIFIKTGSATQISYFQNWASLMYSNYKPF